MKENTKPFVLLAKEAQKIADKTSNYSYLDNNILKTVFKTIRDYAERHHYSARIEISNVYLTDAEIAYCKSVLEKAGYQNINIKMQYNEMTGIAPCTLPIVKFSLNW